MIASLSLYLSVLAYVLSSPNIVFSHVGILPHGPSYLVVVNRIDVKCQ